MRNRLARLGILLLVLGVLSSQTPAAVKGKSGKPGVKPPPPPAEAGSWSVTVAPESDASAKGEKQFDDTLVLNKGKFQSTACLTYGFGTVPYRVAADTWMADVESPKEGKTHWHGEVSGNSISGKMTWTKPDGTVLSYSFSGARAGAQNPQPQKSH